MPPGLSEEKISLVPLAVIKPPASNSFGPLTGGGNIIGLFQLSSFPLDKYISLSSGLFLLDLKPTIVVPSIDDEKTASFALLVLIFLSGMPCPHTLLFGSYSDTNTSS